LVLHCLLWFLMLCRLEDAVPELELQQLEHARKAIGGSVRPTQMFNQLFLPVQGGLTRASHS
jgi:hypothetical protein